MKIPPGLWLAGHTHRQTSIQRCILDRIVGVHILGGSGREHLAEVYMDISRCLAASIIGVASLAIGAVIICDGRAQNCMTSPTQSTVVRGDRANTERGANN